MIHFYMNLAPARGLRFLTLVAQLLNNVLTEGVVLRKTAFLSHIYIKTNILPRQARDKRRENSKKDAVFRTCTG
jgi:hypothetical protein